MLKEERLRAVEWWQALHDDCPWPGCGQCHYIEMDIEPKLLSRLQVAAAIQKVPLEVFIFHCVREGLKILQYDKR